MESKIKIIDERIDFYLIFSNNEHYINFKLKNLFKHIILENEKINEKSSYILKSYALNILKENKNYEYFICCDSEIGFIMENMNYENILNKINMIFENKLIFAGTNIIKMRPVGYKILQESAEIFKDSNNISKIKF